MSAETNKNVRRRFADEVINQYNLAVIEEALAPDYVNLYPGPEAEKHFIKLFKDAFSDGRVDLVEMIAEGGAVATRGRFTGTHRGEFFGIPPTGKQIAVQTMNFFRVANGKIVENRPYLDMMVLLQQLGAVPAPAGAA